MSQLHLKIIAGNVAIFFFAGCVLGSSVFGAGSESSAALSAEEKRFIMSADTMKKRKKRNQRKSLLLIKNWKRKSWRHLRKVLVAGTRG